MKIFLGKKEYEFPDGSNLANIVGKKEFPRISAIWVNGNHILPSMFDFYPIQDGDHIKVQRIYGGG